MKAAGLPAKAKPGRFHIFTGIAQSVEHWSPKPGVGSSSLSSCAKENKMKKLKLLTDIEESYNELRYKTSWPTKEQLIKSSIIVLIASIIIALIIFVMDQLVDLFMHAVYTLGQQ